MNIFKHLCPFIYFVLYQKTLKGTKHEKHKYLTIHRWVIQASGDGDLNGLPLTWCTIFHQGGSPLFISFVFLEEHLERSKDG